MKTQLKTEVRGIAIELSITEALVFLKDPSRVQNEIHSMLNGGGIEVPEKSNYGRDYKTVNCPDCGRELKKTGLKIHQTRFCPEVKRVGASALDSQASE
jgi:hypothetical protein